MKFEVTRELRVQLVWGFFGLFFLFWQFLVLNSGHFARQALLSLELLCQPFVYLCVAAGVGVLF
jgi:hypothetical protein